MTKQEIIEDKKKSLSILKKKAEEASIENKLWCYEPKIEQLEKEIKLYEKEN